MKGLRIVVYKGAHVCVSYLRMVLYELLGRLLRLCIGAWPCKAPKIDQFKH